MAERDVEVDDNFVKDLGDELDRAGDATERRLDREGAEGGEDDAEDLDDLDGADVDDDADDRGRGRNDDDDEDEEYEEEDELEDAAPAKGAADKAAPLPDGYKRDEKGNVHRPDGTMASKEELEQLATKPAVDAAKPDAAAADAPKWEPYVIKADGQDRPIGEAVGISRSNGHVFIAVPEAKFNEFNRRIGLGIVAQRMSRDLDTRIREVEQYEREMKENPLPTPESIEANVWLDAIMGRGQYEGRFENRIKELFEPNELDLLERDVKLALHAAEKAHAAKTEERRTSETKSQEEATRYDYGLSEAIDLIAKENPTWDALPIEQLRSLLTELKPAGRTLLGANDDGTLYVTGHGAAIIRRALNGVAASAAPATRTDPKPDAATASDKHDRFNEGVDKAAKPIPSTSVKANRDDRRDRSRDRGNRGDRRPKKDRRTREQRDEDDIRSVTRNFLNAPGLDF